MKFLLVSAWADSILNLRGPLIRALQDHNLEVHVAAPELSIDSPLRLELESHGLHVHQIQLDRVGTNPFVDFRTIYQLWKLMRQLRPEYFLGYNIKAVIYGLLAAWLARVPHRCALIPGVGYAFQGAGARGRLQELVRRMYRLALSRARVVIFQNPDDKQLFQQLGILTTATAAPVVNGSGVDLVRFAASPFPSGPLRFIFIGRLLGDKGVREYAEAACTIRRLHPDASFAVAGWIDESPDAIRQEELQRWISDGTIEFLGRLSDVRPAIAASSVMVLPSYREGTPRAVLEAMAMGRPAITTDAPGCRETVVDGYNGFLVPVKSVEALHTAMLKFIKSPPLVTAMGQRAREIAEIKYNVHAVNAEMMRCMGMSTVVEPRNRDHESEGRQRLMGRRGERYALRYAYALQRFRHLFTESRDG